MASFSGYNRGGSYRGYGGNRGGGTRGTNYYDGLIRVNGTDRYCTACGRIIKGLATTMIATCPHNACGAPIPLRAGPDTGDFDATGWGRCSNCKSFLNKDHMHCQSCSQVNNVAKEKRERLKKKEMQEERQRMMKKTQEKDAYIAQLEQEKEELRAMVGKQESELFVIKARTGITGDFTDDDLDASLSGIDESQLGDSNTDDSLKASTVETNSKYGSKRKDEKPDKISELSAKSAKLDDSKKHSDE